MRVPVFTIVGFLMLGSAVASAEVPDATTTQPTTTTNAAPTSADNQAPTPVTSKYDPDERICKQFKITGQLIPGKPICHTRAEWTEINRQAQEMTEKAQNQTHTGHN
jgi:hypothetical protein